MQIEYGANITSEKSGLMLRREQQRLFWTELVRNIELVWGFCDKEFLKILPDLAKVNKNVEFPPPDFYRWKM